MKKFLPSLLLCSLAFALHGCGGDYNANPDVCDPDDDLIIEGETNCHNQNNTTPGNTNNTNTYIEGQLAALQSHSWVSQCLNSQRVNVSFGRNSRITTITSFDDDTCTTVSSAEPVVINETYTADSIVRSQNFDAIRIRYTNTASSVSTDNLFYVNGGILYMGGSELDLSDYYVSP